MKRFFFTNSVLMALFLISKVAAFGCSCSGVGSPASAFQSSDAIFLGTVTKVYSQTRKLEAYRVSGKEAGEKHEIEIDTYAVSFNIDEAFKGVKGKTALLETDQGGGSCGYYFEVGKSYLVYARGKSDDRLSTNICTRTRAWEKAENDIAVIRSIKEGKPETRIFGVVEKKELKLNGLYASANYSIPVNGVKVYAQGATGKHWTETDNQGRFSLVNVPFGEYQVEVELPLGLKVWAAFGDSRFEHKTIISESNPATETRFVLEADAPVGGEVFDSKGDLVQEQIKVDVVLVEDDLTLISKSRSASAYTKKGKYSFDGLPPGKYLVGINLFEPPYKGAPYTKVFYPNTSEVGKATSIQVEAGKKIKIDFRLPLPLKERVITGKVLLNGVLAAGVTVNLSEVTNPKQPIHGLRYETGSDGAFLIKCFSGRQYIISGYRYQNGDEWHIAPLEISLDESPSTIILTLLKKEKQ